MGLIRRFVGCALAAAALGLPSSALAGPSALYASNGTLSVHGAQPYVTNLTNPTGIAVSPSGRSLYVVLDNNGGGPVEEFNVGKGGNLTPKPTPSIDAGDFPEYIVLTPNGKYAYVASNPGGGAPAAISQYRWSARH